MSIPLKGLHCDVLAPLIQSSPRKRIYAKDLNSHSKALKKVPFLNYLLITYVPNIDFINLALEQCPKETRL